MKVSELVSQNVTDLITNYHTWGGIIINVKSYGATGDGTSDDTAAIQQAIDYAISIGMHEVTFPPGSYHYGVLNNTAGLTFVGDGVTLTGTTPITLASYTTLKAQLAGAGTVTGVSSANSDIAVSNPSTTPQLTVNAANSGANKILRLDGSGNASADILVDGSTNKAYTAAEKSKLSGVAPGATANVGTVTNVTSANSDASVATGTSTPAITINTGAGANQIVKRNGSSNIVDVGALSSATTLNKTDVISISNEINSRRKDFGLSVKDFLASGSVQATTGSIISGTNALTLASAIDFSNGQGIRVNGIFEVASLTITAGATSSANCSITLGGVVNSVGLTSGNTATQVATFLRSVVFEGWTTGGSGTTVTFTCVSTGNQTDATYSAGTTGATGTMTTPTQGTADLLTTITSGAGTTSLVLAANASTTVSGLIVSHDDTTAVQNTINAAVAAGTKGIFFPHGSYNVATGLTSLSSVALFGDNAIFTGTYNGIINQIAINEPVKAYIHGMEYLYYFHEKLRTNSPVLEVASGDSTTFGTSITDPNYLIHTLVKSMLNKYGVKTVTAVNAGHAGMRTVQWQSSYLATDLALNPDLYILRWGLNDAAANPVSTRLSIFTNALRGGLATLRAAKTVNQMSVILMMPNSTNDPTNGRDVTWFNAIYPVIKQAARDYQCCFIDTYNYLLDSTVPVWQDDLASNGVHIHPLNTGNAWIVGLMSEAIIPDTLRYYGMTNTLSSDVTKLASDLPNSYPVGTSLYRSGTGFPYDGIVTTVYQTDGILLQFNSGLYAQTAEAIAIRRGLLPAGIPGSINTSGNVWAPWLYVKNSESYTNLTLQNSWVYFGSGATAQYMLDGAGNVHIKGMIKSGTITGGTVIAALPSGYRPTESFYVSVVSNGAWGYLQILSNGNITVGFANATWVDFGRIIFKAEQ